MKMEKIKIIISGGGSGGHIFPAIAIADSLKKRTQNVDFLFVGAKGKMEMDKVPAMGYKIKGLWINGLQRKITVKNLIFPIKVAISYINAFFIIKNFKPDVVIGTGGFASAPTLKASTTLKIKTLIQEQNSFPGITNKMLAKKVDKICVAYPETEKWFPKNKIVLTGNPVRLEIANFKNNKVDALNCFKLDKQKPVALILGGSLGALTINKSIFNNIDTIIKNNIQLIWQTGKSFYEQVISKFANVENIRIFDFISNIELAYAAADVIISRAGAITISELCCIGKPVILIPSPNVAEDHQTKNALALVNKNAALMIKDYDAEKELVTTLISLLNNEELKNKLSKNISSLAKPNATELIVDEVIKLIDNKNV